MNAFDNKLTKSVYDKVDKKTLKRELQDAYYKAVMEDKDHERRM